jgi:hypothetical protein
MNAGVFSFRMVNLTGTGAVMQYWLDGSKR